jgi:glycosidase
MLSLYRRLIHFRKHSPALMRGAYLPLDTGNSDVFGFMREAKGEWLMIALNFSAEERRVSLGTAHGVRICTTAREEGSEQASIDLRNVLLRPFEGRIIQRA